MEIDFDDDRGIQYVVDLKDRKKVKGIHFDLDDDDTFEDGFMMTGRRKLRTNECGERPTKIIEVVAVNDVSRFEALGSVTESRTAELFSLVADLFTSPTGGLYDPPLLDCTLQPVLVGQITWTTTPASMVYAQGPTACEACQRPTYTRACSAMEIQAGCLLTSFLEWALVESRRDIQNMFELETIDTSQLLSHVDFSAGTVGLAPGLGSACHPLEAGAVNQVGVSQSMSVQALIVAHEMGHNIGISHDSAGDFIMGPHLDPSYDGTPPKAWSDQSKENFKTYLEASYGIFTTGTYTFVSRQRSHHR